MVSYLVTVRLPTSPQVTCHSYRSVSDKYIVRSDNEGACGSTGTHNNYTSAR